MLMQNMDETLDVKPCVIIEGKQLELLKIESAAAGDKYVLTAEATISGINQNKGPDGINQNSITFELTKIQLENPETDLSQMFPNSPAMVKA